jgi:hypothetical protein
MILAHWQISKLKLIALHVTLKDSNDIPGIQREGDLKESHGVALKHLLHGVCKHLPAHYT